MKLFICTFILTGFYLANAQQYISYTYDAAGNRVKRQLVTGTFRKAPSDTLPISDVVAQSKFLIYPNPTSAMVTVVLDQADVADTLSISYTLMDISAVVLEQKSNVGKKVEFDLTNRPSGVYLLKIQKKDEEVVWRVVKQ